MQRVPRSGPEVDELGREVRELLAPFSARRLFPAGTVLWREGEIDGMMVALDSGQVRITRALSTGDPITILILGPGDVCGFMPLVDGGPYPATAQAITDVSASVVSRPALHRALERSPQLAVALLTVLGRRLSDAFERIEVAAEPDAVVRVARALCSLVPKDRSGPLLVVELPVPSAEMAAVLGMVPASFSRGVTKLVASGVVHRLAARRLQVLEPDRLCAIARGTACAIGMDASAPAA